MEFYEEVQEEGNISTSKSASGVPKANYPVVIISRPKNNEARACITPKIIIQKPATFPYKDSKKVPWNYECNTTILGKETSAAIAEEDQGVGSHTHSGRRYDLLHKQPARISVLALLFSLEVHRSALMKVLNETYVANDISVNKLYRLVNNISADNIIFLSDDEIPSGGRGSTKALHITTRCKGYTFLGVLIDNGSTLNVLPLSTLNRLPVDSSHMKACQNIVRAFDGTKRRVMGRIEIPLIIGPTTYEVHFLVMDIKPSYNCLLGRPWIHSTGAVTISAEEDIIATITNDAPYVETDDKALECSFRSLEFVNATFITKGDRIPVPRISNTMKMGLQLMVGMGALLGRGLGRHLQGRIEAPVLKNKFDHFGLGYKPDMRQKKKELEKRQERRMARLRGDVVKWEPMTSPHISKTFVSRGIIHPQKRIPIVENIREILENVYINSIHEDTNEEGTLLGIRPYEPGSVLNNWTAEEIPEVFRAFLECPDINDMSDSAISENPFERDMCLEGSQNFEDDIDSNLSPDLLRMVEQDEKQILPHKEVVEIVTPEEGKVVKMGTRITEETKRDLIVLLQEFKDVFAWSYQDMLGLNTDIVVYRLPIRDDCKPVQQKLRRMRPDVVLKIKEEVQKQFDVGFPQVVKYSEWVANIVLVPKKDGKVRMCVDYRDLNKASPKYNFPLPHIDTLVDNMARCSLFSFMDGFLRYNQIKMHSEDMTKTTFITLWGTFCYRVMPFGLKNAGAIYHRAMVTLFHDMMHKEIDVYVDDMIAKSQTEKEHVQVLRKLFLRLRKFQLKRNPVKCTFGTRSGKLLGFVVSEKGIEIDLDKVKAIQELSPPRTQKEKAVKRSAIVDFLASRALEDYEPLDFDFPNEDLMCVATAEQGSQKIILGD
ncbi:uncharacterized protein LOC128034775 [Gossypium raimondii]|uniref:uncharacterized protein LOC128034775 n=1 Tax=Gossypium raimondii TaxID=29730 RepID=UPI00227CB547|nr:uncharacterized protein LOC128034775 [Gossypium raimondii]